MPKLKGFEKIVRPQTPLADRTWLRLGGPAEFFAEPTSVDELVALVKRCREEELPAHLLGGGSNVLVRSEGVRGVVISLAAPCFQEIRVDGHDLTARGGAKLSHVVSEAVRAGLGGLEPLVGIPGTLGGALHSNSGTHGGDVGQWAHQASVITRVGDIVERGSDDLVFAYRSSSLDELVILEATFRLEPGDPHELTKRMQKQWIVTRANQPMSDENAGCIFKNPRGMSAGMLVDLTGLKGTTVGGAEVSSRHANFIIAHKGATSDDVLKLIDTIRSRVSESMGVELELALDIW
jgi:UDP-N-acetylmuramate dehydrogenase